MIYLGTSVLSRYFTLDGVLSADGLGVLGPALPQREQPR